MLLSGSSEAAASELVAHPELFGKFKLTQPPVLGKDVNLILSLSNLSDSPKTVAVNLSVSSVLYTRRAVKEILKEATSLHLGGKEGTPPAEGAARLREPSAPAGPIPRQRELQPSAGLPCPPLQSCPPP